MKWIEEKPNEGDTVKVFLSIPKQTLIGVVLKYHFDRVIIDFGGVKKYLPTQSTFFVWK
jgi:hypothetical protein